MDEQVKQDVQVLQDESIVNEAFKAHLHGDNDAAIRMLSEFVERWPEHIEANYNLAVCLKTTGQTREAARLFRKTQSLIGKVQANQEEVDMRLTMLSEMIDHQLAVM